MLWKPLSIALYEKPVISEKDANFDDPDLFYLIFLTMKLTVWDLFHYAKAGFYSQEVNRVQSCNNNPYTLITHEFRNKYIPEVSL